MHFRKVAALVLPLIALTACNGGDTAPDTTVAAVDSTIPDVARPISWKPCVTGFADGDECGTIKVPFDYSDPSVGEFTLHLRRHPAQVPSERIGSLLVNPGGPGFGGIFLAEEAGSYFSSDLTDRFDIVAWDPRGTGESTPYVDCIDNYDDYFAVDPTPATPEEKQTGIDLAKKFNEACQAKSGKILPYISTNNSVRDMESIRRALGEEKISYLGFSYGSELGATWATMFPHTVRVAVLDGAADPTADAIQGGLQQAAGFEKELNTFLDECSADVKCAFHNNGKAGDAFDALVKKIDAEPVVVSPDRTPVNLAVLYTGVSEAMYSSSMWTELENALADLQKGKGAGMLSLNDQYFQRKPDGTYGNELEAFNAISCIDDPGPKSVEESDKWIPEFMKVAPRLGPSFSSGYGCVFWPAKPDHRIAITGKGAGPILVVGTTGDSATPLASSRKMAETLEDGRLIVNNAQRHTGYGSNDCVTSAVDDYLITAKISFREKAC